METSALINNLNLPATDQLKIRSVFLTFPQVEKVWLYGSRAKGTAKAYSDIDISIEGNRLNLEVINELELALDELSLPYGFDISMLKDIENEDLLAHIKRVGKLIYDAS